MLRKYTLKIEDFIPRRKLSDRLHRMLRLRLVLFFVLSLIMIGISTYNIVITGRGLVLSITAFLLGILGGLIASRILKISWDEELNQVISRFDTIGITILVFYTLFEIFRNTIVARFVEGPVVFTVSSALLAGLMYGRSTGMHRNIRHIFEAKDIEE